MELIYYRYITGDISVLYISLSAFQIHFCITEYMQNLCSVKKMQILHFGGSPVRMPGTSRRVRKYKVFF